ncbi:hypothetical protein ACHMW6_26805 [Pseudoduganella sp. UC29_106]|uniref:hypothetical protein n=1 Tax=Pseudoduganella sp. UC29_106 TaxID=3374553 RepID=UPI0037567C90
MKRLSLLLLSAGLLSACSYIPFLQKEEVAQAPVKRKSAQQELGADGTPRVVVDGVEVQKVEFRPGISSATVERLAHAQSCKGGLGASLMTEPGPVEVYRMACDNGKVFLARCELRQCTPMVPGQGAPGIAK